MHSTTAYTLPPRTTETQSQSVPSSRSTRFEVTDDFEDFSDEPTAEAVPEVAPSKRTTRSVAPSVPIYPFLPRGKEEPVDEFTTTTSTAAPTTLTEDDAGAFRAGSDYDDYYYAEEESGESTTISYHIV